MTQRDVDHFLGRRHLEIERYLEVAHQARDVVIDDVAAIFTQMRGNAVGTGGLGETRRPQRIGQMAAARIAHRRHVIDVHSKTQRGMRGHTLLSQDEVAGIRQLRARSTALMAGVARRAAVMSARCFTSATSTSITMSKKSIERLTMRRLEMLPSCRAITVDRLDKLPGWLDTVIFSRPV